jgi:hypothetical protein
VDITSDAIIVSAAAVLAAVLTAVIAEGLARARDRRLRIEHAVGSLALDVPYVAGLIVDGGQEPETSVGSLWHSKQESTTALLSEVRALTHGHFRRRKWRRVHREANDLAARLGALWLRFSIDGRRPSFDEAVAITIADLYRAVFGVRGNLDRMTAWYRSHGFSDERPPDR